MLEQNSLPLKSVTAPALSADDFNRVAELVRRRTGMELRAGKEQLVINRLSRLIRDEGCGTFGAYLRQVEKDSSGRMMVDLVNAMTTNYTSFNREPLHFQFLRDVIWAKHPRGAPLSIWSAASSTGEEAYSIVCTLLEAANQDTLPMLSVLATDVSTKVLSEAELGVYADRRCASAPKTWLQRYFTKGLPGAPDSYQVKANVRGHVRFRPINLAMPLTLTSTFHVIFCRNVLIYFEPEMQARIIEQLTRTLNPGGYLFVGHAEGLAGVTHSLRYVQPAVYRKQP